MMTNALAQERGAFEYIARLKDSLSLSLARHIHIPRKLCSFPARYSLTGARHLVPRVLAGLLDFATPHRDLPHIPTWDKGSLIV